jgi:hypothetical protein
MFWLSLAAVIWRLSFSNLRPRSSILAFLLLWLALEIAGYFALSPFPAARRVLGIVVVATVLTGRLATMTPSRTRWPLQFATAVGSACGVFVTIIDFQEALATHQATETAAAVVNGERHGGTTWYSATWAVCYYAERDGMVPLAPNRQHVRAGDLLVIVEQPLIRFAFALDRAPVTPVAVIDQQDDLPWRTVVCYYGGRTPLQHHEGPRLRLTVYRVLADFVPTTHGVLAGLP